MGEVGGVGLPTPTPSAMAMTPAQLAAMAAAQMAAQRQQMVNAQVRRASAPRRACHARAGCTRSPAHAAPAGASKRAPGVDSAAGAKGPVPRSEPAATRGGCRRHSHTVSCTQLMGMQGLFPTPVGLGMQVPAAVTPVSPGRYPSVSPPGIAVRARRAADG